MFTGSHSQGFFLGLLELGVSVFMDVVCQVHSFCSI
jgi:hypothetical protein